MTDESDSEQGYAKFKRRDILSSLVGVGVGGTSGVAFYRSYIHGRDPFPGVGRTIEAIQNPPSQGPQGTPPAETIHEAEIDPDDLDPNRSVRIGFATDGHYSDHQNYARDYNYFHQQIINHFQEEEIDLALFGGDNICHPNRGEKEAAEELIQKYYSDLEAPFYAAHGNHDQMGDEDWFSAFGHEKNTRFEMEDVGVIILDSADEDGEETPPDLDFLEESLNQLEQKNHVFVMSHYWFNEDYSNLMTGPGSAEHMSQEAVELIHSQDNVRALLHGHNHGDNTGQAHLIENQGIKKPYISGRVFGGTNRWIKEGYWIIDIDSNGIEFIFKHI